MPKRELKLPKQTSGRYQRLELKRVTRAAEGDANADWPTYEIAISSEYTVTRWWGSETLAHESDAVDMTRLNARAAVLIDHGGDQIGVVERAWLDDDRVLRGEIRFSRSQRGRDVEQDVLDGIRQHVSVGYRIHEAQLVAEREGVEEWRITRWEPHEVSLVAVPADPTVGVGRALAGDELPVRITYAARSADGDRQMPEQNPAAPAANASNPAPAAITGGADRAAEQVEIVQLCTDAGRPELAARFLGENKTAKQVAIELFRAKAAESAKPLPQPGAERLDAVPAKDRSKYRYARAIHMACEQREGRGTVNGLEAEISQEIERQLPATYKRNNGSIFVPMSLSTEEELEARRAQRRELAVRALQSNLPRLGAELVGEQFAEIIEILRARVVASQLGATFLTGINGPVVWPAQTAAMTASWIGEAPVAPGVGQTDPQFGFKVLSPKTLMASNNFSRQLIATARFDIEQMVRNEIAAVHARAIDRALFHGQGAAGEPAGIYITPDVNVVAIGGAPTFAQCINMIGAIADDNADVTSLAFVTTPLAAARLMQTLEFAAAGARAVWTGTITDGQVAGYRAVATNSVSKTLGGGSNEHGIIAGNFADVVIGTWGAMELVVDPYTQARQGLVNVTSFEMTDVLLRRGESFARGTGMIP